MGGEQGYSGDDQQKCSYYDIDIDLCCKCMCVVTHTLPHYPHGPHLLGQCNETLVPGRPPQLDGGAPRCAGARIGAVEQAARGGRGPVRVKLPRCGIPSHIEPPRRDWL